jgi:hypothetical protein
MKGTKYFLKTTWVEEKINTSARECAGFLVAIQERFWNFRHKRITPTDKMHSLDVHLAPAGKDLESNDFRCYLRSTKRIVVSRAFG